MDFLYDPRYFQKADPELEQSLFDLAEPDIIELPEEEAEPDFLVPDEPEFDPYEEDSPRRWLGK